MTLAKKSNEATIEEVMQKKHRIQFPKPESSDLKQDQAYFYLQGSGGQRKIRLHYYDKLFQVQGLYEQIFYDRLKCTSQIGRAHV